MNGRRAGAALVLALVMLVVLDCIVLGTLHLSLQEHRIGANSVTLLTLRIQAESAVRRSLGHWSDAYDSMRIGAAHGIALTMPAEPATMRLERLGEQLFLVTAETAEPPPRVGRASARIMITPPALPPLMDPAPAPISATGQIHVLQTGVITAAPAPGCTSAGAAATTLTRSSSDVVAEPGASLDAAPGVLDSDALITAFSRIASLAHDRPSVVLARGDTVISSHGAGVLIIEGSLTLSGAGSFRGLILVRGSLTIDPGTTVAGAVHAAGDITLAGAVHWDACAAREAIANAGLHRPQPAGTRAWVPAF